MSSNSAEERSQVNNATEPLGALGASSTGTSVDLKSKDLAPQAHFSEAWEPLQPSAQTLTMKQNSNHAPVENATFQLPLREKDSKVWITTRTTEWADNP